MELSDLKLKSKIAEEKEQVVFEEFEITRHFYCTIRFQII